MQCLFESNHEAFKEYQKFVEEFGAETNRLVTVTFYRKEGIFHQDAVKHIREVQEEIRQLKGVQSQISFLDILDRLPQRYSREQSRQLITALPLFRKTLVSPDGKTGTIILETNFTSSAQESSAFFQALNRILNRREKTTSLDIHMAGVPVVNNEYIRLIKQDNRRFLPVAAVSLLLILFVLFRHWKGVVFPIISVSLGIIWTTGILVLSGGHIGVMNIVVPTLILCIGIADSIHILCRYQEHPVGENGLKQTFQSMSIACLLTSFTTAIGFGTLIVTTVMVVRNFGLLTATGLLLTYAISMIFLFSSFSITPSFPNFAKDKPAPEPESDPSDVQQTHHLGNTIRQYAEWYLQYPRIIIGIFVVLIMLSLLGISRIRSKSSWFQALQKDSPIRAENRWIENHLGAVFTMEAVLTNSEGKTFHDPDLLKKLHQIQTRIERNKLVSHTRTIVELLQTSSGLQSWLRSGNVQLELPSSETETSRLLADISSIKQLGNPVNRYLTKDHKKARLTMYLFNPDSQEAEQLVEDTNKQFSQSSIDVSFTGLTVAAKKALEQVLRDMLFSVGLAIIFIFLVMSYRFSSIRLGVISMIPNIIPIMTTFAIMGWTGISLNFSTITIFSISLGIAVDDTIHTLHAIQEKRQQHQRIRPAVLHAIENVGRPLVFTTIALIFGFGSILTSNFQFTFHFGMLGATTIISALFADLLLLPALIIQFGKREIGEEVNELE